MGHGVPVLMENRVEIATATFSIYYFRLINVVAHPDDKARRRKYKALGRLPWAAAQRTYTYATRYRYALRARAAPRPL
jgi:hypothetical protein